MVICITLRFLGISYFSVGAFLVVSCWWVTRLAFRDSRFYFIKLFAFSKQSYYALYLRANKVRGVHKKSSFLQLLQDFILLFFGYDAPSCLFVCLDCIYPVIERDISLCVPFYFISYLQGWHMIFSKYLMQSRGTDAQLISYCPLLLIFVIYPFGEFVHVIFFLYLLMCTKIWESDTRGILAF